MKKELLITVILSLLIGFISFGQEQDDIFERLQGISNDGVYFFNVDGMEITSQTKTCKLTAKDIRRKFKPLSLKRSDVFVLDSLFENENLTIRKTIERYENIFQYSNYYFIKTDGNKLTAITIASNKLIDREFERNFVSIILKNEIPTTVFSPLTVDTINFDGRKIFLGSSCRWMGVNNVQCPYYGQMNWSVHRTLEDAQKSIDIHLEIMKIEPKGKVVSEEMVDVIFEGNEVEVKRIIYDFTGMTSVLVGMSGGKTLTIYFVAGEGQKNYISCVMSFWNNDSINPSGLSPLLEKIITLKE
ncbi:MAG: hypothetical protein GQ527_03465 [Bacteroidales bacterium]|nr:hypothetical protein [Bacteroidales bacterium]